jgi:two-component system phosphate regulon sensor histidine kinase PhoR
LKPLLISLIFAALLFIIFALVIYYFVRDTFQPIGQLDDMLHSLLKKEPYSFLALSKFRVFNNISRNLEEIDYLLKKYEKKLSRHKVGFYGVIDTINEAMWMQNEKGIITVSNNKFQQLVENQEVNDQYFWNVITNYDLYMLVDSIFKQPRNILQELQIAGIYYLCSVSYSIETNVLIFILYNINEIKKLEMMKKDFVLNISHELRTPLTSIKGFLETLEPELESEQLQYLNIIKRNTDRLISIVNDLLTLSRLEHDTSLELETIKIDEMLSQLHDIFRSKASAKGIELHFTNPDKIPTFRADKFKMEQVLINLLDNSLKYTEQGIISFNLRKEQNNLIFEISDTGIGIPAEHQARIFERFYVVNKSRARKYSSTGLGLSIVKHIVNLHNGIIELVSKPGEGTRIIIRLPQKFKSEQ